jgi:transposase
VAVLPLYRVEEFYEEMDVEQLFGLGRCAHDFNDDVLGRTLDRLYEAESWRVYSTFALSTLRKLGFSLHVIHSDTTSISVYGEYEAHHSEAPQVTYGYSKDHRPDLKQIILGLGITPERLLILQGVTDGNKDDKTWDREWIGRLRRVLSDEQWDTLTYVADSALVIKDNLSLLAEEKLAFVSRLPDTYTLSQELKKQAMEGEWEAIGRLSEDRQGAVYRAQSFVYSPIVWPPMAHSSRLAEKEEQRLQSKIDQKKENGGTSRTTGTGEESVDPAWETKKFSPDWRDAVGTSSINQNHFSSLFG